MMFSDWHRASVDTSCARCQMIRRELVCASSPLAALPLLSARKCNMQEFHKRACFHCAPWPGHTLDTHEESSEGQQASQTLCMSSISSSLHDRTGLSQTDCAGGIAWTASISDWYAMRAHMSSRSMTLMATSLPFSRSNLQIAFVLSPEGKAFARKGTAVADLGQRRPERGSPLVNVSKGAPADAF